MTKITLRQYISTATMVLLSSVMVATSVFPAIPASALTGTDFNPGNIIDDTIFFNGNTMRASIIQDFLTAKVPACDTYGAKAYNSTMTRAQYSATKGVSTPFICLRDYSQSTPSMPYEQGLCNQFTSGQRTAAQIIADVGVACSINPQVLLVLLQKEQGLITDDWPWPIEYSAATGFGCPDTAPCDTSYGGFFYQVYYAARQFKRYARDASSFNYRAGRNNTVAYNPNTSCSSSSIYIQNQATAGLYDYTPYQPNSAALNNLYGLGDGCSAYGNRNFWRIFNDWFGSTKYATVPGCNEATNTSLACVWRLRKIGTDAEVLTSSISERDQLLAGQGYIFMGSEFFGNVVIAPHVGNIPVYRLKKADGTTFLTTSSTEKDGLVAAGVYSYIGIDFYADPAGSNSGYLVYRLHSTNLDQYIWVSNATERQQLLDNGWADQGIAFTSISSVVQEITAPPNKQLVFRFYIPQTYSHLWTTQITERDNLIRAGYHYEGVAWYGSSSTAATPVYRLYAPAINQHLYTIDAYERDVLAAYHGWIYEGVAQYVSTVNTGSPTYRLYAPSLGVHHLTNDAYERSVLLNSGNWKDEGVAWYQP